MKQTDFQERHKIADVWEDDVYIVTDWPIFLANFDQLIGNLALLIFFPFAHVSLPV